MLLELVNKLAVVFVIGGLVSILLLFLKPVRAFVSKHGLLIGFVLAVAGTLVSLYYSEIIGYPPCKLCWLQRIFFYPQVILLGIAYWKKDFRIRIYSLVLTILGGIIGLYQVLLEHGLAPNGVCGAVGPSCTARFVYELGFVTIPTMSLMGFVLIAVSVYMLKYRD